MKFGARPDASVGCRHRKGCAPEAAGHRLKSICRGITLRCRMPTCSVSAKKSVDVSGPAASCRFVYGPDSLFGDSAYVGVLQIRRHSCLQMCGRPSARLDPIRENTPWSMQSQQVALAMPVGVCAIAYNRLFLKYLHLSDSHLYFPVFITLTIAGQNASFTKRNCSCDGTSSSYPVVKERGSPGLTSA